MRRGIPYLYVDQLPPPPVAYTRWIHDYYRVPFSERQRRKTERMARLFLDLTRPETPVLDVGCGRAEKAAWFGRGGYIGLDPIDPLAAGMVAQLEAPIVCGRGERLPFEGNQFTSVVIWAAIDHVADRKALFTECARVLRDGGALCVFSQVVAQRGSRARGLFSWLIEAIRSLDVAGMLAVVRFSFANPRVRRYLQPLTADQLVAEVAAVFRRVEPHLVEPHVLILRAEK